MQKDNCEFLISLNFLHIQLQCDNYNNLDMKLEIIFKILILFIKLYSIFAKSKFLKIDECSASNVTAKINLCEIVDGKLSIRYVIFKPLNHAQVKIKNK